MSQSISVWCSECGGARWYVFEHYVQRPVVKACMCARWFPDMRQGRFKAGTDSNFYQLLENGLVVSCEPFAPHIHKAKKRKAS